MKKSRRMAGSVGVLAAVAVAASALIVTSVGSAAPSQAIPGRGRHRRRPLQRQGLQLSFRSRAASRREEGLRVDVSRVRVTLDGRRPPAELHELAAQQGRQLVIGVGFLLARPLGEDREEVPERRTSRSWTTPYGSVRSRRRGKPLSKNVLGLTVRDEREQLHDRLPRRARWRARGSTNTISATGGNKVPTVTIFIAAYSLRALAKKCGEGARRTTSTTRRTSSTRRSARSSR